MIEGVIQKQHSKKCLNYTLHRFINQTDRSVITVSSVLANSLALSVICYTVFEL